MQKLSVIIPCFNEAKTIAEVVRRVRATFLPPGWESEVVVVDDGSGAETHAALKDIQGMAQVVYRASNGGKGAAIKDGLRAAHGSYFLIQDADVELDPAEIPSLLAPIDAGQAQAVFGYRVLARASGRPPLFYGGKLVSLLYNLMFATRFRDIPCAYKLFPASCVPSLLAMPSNDFVFDAIEMTRVISRACTVAQVPVAYRPRSSGQGKKLRPLDGIRCAAAVVLMRLGLYHPSVARELPRMVRFLVAGLLAAFINVASLLILVEFFHAWYLGASVAAFLFGYVVSFLLQKFWTFENRNINGVRHQLPLHFMLALCNLALNTLLIFTLVGVLHWWYVPAALLATMVIAADSFLVSRFIFRK